MDAERTLDGGRLPIDLEHLSRYTAARPDTIRDLLTIFRDQAGNWMKGLSSDGDMKAWRESAHTLKGAAMAIGAWPLGELCEEAEALAEGAAEHEAETVRAARDDLAARLRSELDRTRRYIDQVIEPLAG